MLLLSGDSHRVFGRIPGWRQLWPGSL